MGAQVATSVQSLTQHHQCTEPGGYLQWDDKDVASWHAISPNLSIPHPNCDELFRRFNAQCAQSDLKFRYPIFPSPPQSY